MKTISKILLPLGTIAATASAVTPLVACGAKDEGANAVDLTKYVPDESTVCKKTSLTEPAATDELFGNENAMELVKQDILTYLAGEAKNELPLVLAVMGFYGVGDIISERCILSDLDLKYDKDTHIASLSGTIRLKAETYMTDPYGVVIGKYTLETEHKISKMPYHMVFTPIEELHGDYGTSYGNINELKENKNGTVNRGYKGVAIYNDSSKKNEEEEDKFLYKYDTVTEENLDELSMIRGWSYFLKDVKKAA